MHYQRWSVFNRIHLRRKRRGPQQGYLRLHVHLHRIFRPCYILTYPVVVAAQEDEAYLSKLLLIVNYTGPRGGMVSRAISLPYFDCFVTYDIIIRGTPWRLIASLPGSSHQ